MIREYALDPSVVSNWSNFRFFTSQFGCEYGRMISRFPKRWKKDVYELCSRNEEVTQIQLSRIEIMLFNLDYNFDRKFVRNSRDYNRNVKWIENAIASNQVKPFFSIITTERLDGCYSASEIDEHTDVWKVPTSLAIKRKPKELVEYFKPFFELTHEIIFIEPHFDPGTQKWYKSFQCYFSKMFENHKQYRKIEIHTSSKVEVNHFANEFKSKFERVIADDIEIKVFMWDRIEDNENFHPRYLMSEIGGIRLDYGFDEGNENETTDVQILGDNIYRLRLSNIQQGTSAFDLKYKIKFHKNSGSLSFEIISSS